MPVVHFTDVIYTADIWMGQLAGATDLGKEAFPTHRIIGQCRRKALGVPDRIGVTEDHVMHCSWSDKYTPDLEAYLDRFLLEKTDGKPTGFLHSKFTDLDSEKWISWTMPELK